MSVFLPWLLKLTSVPLFFITEVTIVPVVALLPRLPVCLWLLVTKVTNGPTVDFLPRLPVCLWLLYYQGYQCAHGCLLPSLPECLWLLVTKVTSVPIVALLPRLPVWTLLLVNKVTRLLTVHSLSR